MEELLKALKANSGRYVSGERLAREAGITRAAIWKQIEQLRALGYRIESAPHLGYRLALPADLLHPAEIGDGLRTSLFGRQIYFRPELDSTNILARRLAEEGAPEGSLVITENQIKGRGRMGRAWSSTPGLGLWFSLVLRPKVSLEALAGLTILTAVELTRSIRETTGIQVAIKWPNDLVWQGRKLVGILAELSAEMGLVHYLVLGIGVNVNHESGDFPPELADKAVSLRQIKGAPLERKGLLQSFLANFEAGYQRQFDSAVMAETIAYAREHSATLGKEVVINQGYGRTRRGTAVDLDWDGSLLLRESASGELVKIHSGDLLEGDIF